VDCDKPPLPYCAVHCRSWRELRCGLSRCRARPKGGTESHVGLRLDGGVGGFWILGAWQELFGNADSLIRKDWWLLKRRDIELQNFRA
jgi:hypothetical protein